MIPFRISCSRRIPSDRIWITRRRSWTCFARPTWGWSRCRFSSIGSSAGWACSECLNTLAKSAGTSSWISPFPGPYRYRATSSPGGRWTNSVERSRWFAATRSLASLLSYSSLSRTVSGSVGIDFSKQSSWFNDFHSLCRHCVASVDSSLYSHRWHVGLFHYCLLVLRRTVPHGCQEHRRGYQQHVRQDRLYLSTFRCLFGKSRAVNDSAERRWLSCSSETTRYKAFKRNIYTRSVYVLSRRSVF